MLARLLSRHDPGKAGPYKQPSALAPLFVIIRIFTKN